MQAPRSRSEQRKLNKIAQIRQTMNSQQPTNKIHYNTSITDQNIAEIRPQIKLKRNYEYSVTNLDIPTSG